jgi:hypothetical protein
MFQLEQPDSPLFADTLSLGNRLWTIQRREINNKIQEEIKGMCRSM